MKVNICKDYGFFVYIVVSYGKRSISCVLNLYGRLISLSIFHLGAGSDSELRVLKDY